MFVIPVGAIAFGLLANAGLISVTSALRICGVHYSKLLIGILSGCIGLIAFWGSQYGTYCSKTMVVNYQTRVPPQVLLEAQHQSARLENQVTAQHQSLQISSQKLEQLKGQINDLDRNAQLGYSVDESRYNQLVRQYNELAKAYNNDVAGKQRLDFAYERQITSTNDLIDQFNKGKIGVVEVTKTHEPISKHFTFLEYIRNSCNKVSLRVFGVAGKVPLATPNINVELGGWGLILFIIEQLAIMLSLPMLWFCASTKK